VALNRIETAVRDAGYPTERDGLRVTVGTAVVGDYLIVDATSMEIGTRVELRGRIEPEIVHAVLRELAKSRPWTWAPAWDGPT
jgi:hypothetical protein